MIRLKRPHHTVEGFRNTFDSIEEAAGVDVFDPDAGAEWDAGVPRPVRPDGEFLRRNRDPSNPTLTWLGHSTFLVQIGGLNILTDPHLGVRASALPYVGPKRLVPPALQVYQLPRIDAVVLSHDHRDHFDRRTMRRLIKQSGGPPNLYVPLGLKAKLGSDAYAHCTELDWWQWAQMSGVVMHCVPAHHDSGRLPWSRDTTLWCGWVIEFGDYRFYFAGDTGYSPALLEIGRKFSSLDLAALPISGHASRWRHRGMHLSPQQAVRLYSELGARQAVAMHWGAFEIGDQALDVAPRRLLSSAEIAGLPPQAFFLMGVGATVSLHSPDGLPHSGVHPGTRPGTVAVAPRRPGGRPTPPAPATG